MRCRTCGSEIRPGVASCHECGTQIQPLVSMCPSCGVELDPAASYCDRCGAKTVSELPLAAPILGQTPAQMVSNTAPPAVGRRLLPLVLVGGLGLLVVALVAGSALIAARPQRLSPTASISTPRDVGAATPKFEPGDCKAVVSMSSQESLAGDTLICYFGISDLMQIERVASRDDARNRINSYGRAQQRLLASLAKNGDLTDRSRWTAESATLDVRSTATDLQFSTREDLQVYRDRYLIRVRLVTWSDDDGMQARCTALLEAARKLVDLRSR